MTPSAANKAEGTSWFFGHRLQPRSGMIMCQSLWHRENQGKKCRADGPPRKEAHGKLEDGRMHYWRLVNFECGLEASLSPKVKFLLSQLQRRGIAVC